MDERHPVTNGYQPEPVLPEQWSFEEHFQSPYTATGDVDLRPFTSPRHNQRQTGTCVAQSVVKALEIKRILQFGREAHVDLSVLAVYYLAREIQFPPQTHIDDGTRVSCACDVLRRFGVPAEADWPFDLNKVNLSPSWLAMRKAYLNKISAFYRIKSSGQDRVKAVAQAIRSGNPVVYGAVIGSQWRQYRKGDVLGVTPNDDPDKGRHATVLLGIQGDLFIGENSWGNNWGDDGFYLASPEMIASPKAGDFWVITGSWEGKV